MHSDTPLTWRQREGRNEYGEKEKGRGRDGGMEREGGRDGGREGGREGGKEGKREVNGMGWERGGTRLITG